MFIKHIFMALLGASFGFIVSGGVFTVLISVGLIPRFAGKMHIAKHIFLLEEMVVLGTLAGDFLSVFSDYGKLGEGAFQSDIRGAGDAGSLACGRKSAVDSVRPLFRYFCRMSGAGDRGDAGHDSDFFKKNRLPARTWLCNSRRCARKTGGKPGLFYTGSLSVRRLIIPAQTGALSVIYRCCHQGIRACVSLSAEREHLS